MKVVLLLSACALSWVMWGIAMLCIAHHAELQARVDVRKADFCIPIRNGPVERPDHYDTHPFRAKGSVA